MMITLYFEKVKEGRLSNTFTTDTYYDESVYLKEKSEDSYICILDEKDFCRECFDMTMRKVYDSIFKKYTD